jgi:predicted Zn-dependent peptidase
MFGIRLSLVTACLFMLTLPLRAETRILFVGLDSAGSFEIRMWVPFGSVSDVAPGTAHLMEHLKFKSSQEKGLQNIQTIPGSAENAETSYNYTRFDIGVRREFLSDALQALIGVSQPLSVTPEQLATEKVIVTQELLQRNNSDPDSPKLLSALLELYKGTELERRPSGTEDSIKAITMDDVIAFDKAHYATADKFLMIAGPAVPADVQGKILEMFPASVGGSIHVDEKRVATRDDAALVALGPFLKSPIAAGLAKDRILHDFPSTRVKTPKLYFTKLFEAPTTYKDAIGARILEEAIRSRLPEGLRDHIADDAGLVQDFGIDIAPLASGVWQLSFAAGLVPGVDPEKVVKVFETYLEDFAKNGISPVSLERLKKRHFLYGEWEDAEQRLKNLGFETAMFGYANAMNGREDMTAVNQDQLQGLLTSLAGPGRVGISVLKPEGAP